MTKRQLKRNPAVKAAKRQSNLGLSNDPILLSSGYWVRVRPVSAHLIDGAQAQVKDPEIPSVYIEEKGREEENPNDPVYLRALERVDVDRSLAATDAMILFGVELINEDETPFELPPDEQWLTKLRLLEKKGIFDLSEFDFDDELDKEFAFKKLVVITAVDLPLIAMANGVQGADIENALDTFQSN
jgi:hypothetical protein